jgi:stearoyl-CoA desaturase (delta-9 desaturase)
VVWGVFVRVAACTTMHWFISYFAHTQGPQDWLVDGAVIQAHNVPLLAIPTMGESWHNNHHAFPSSARHGLYPGQIDLGWSFVQLLEALNLAWNVKLPANLPPRPGITPVQPRALSMASPGQGTVGAKG